MDTHTCVREAAGRLIPPNKYITHWRFSTDEGSVRVEYCPWCGAKLVHGFNSYPVQADPIEPVAERWLP
jgi:hypothetical protein